MSDLFTYPTRGPGRPQILLVGNGLERCVNQVSWDALLDNITVPTAPKLTREQRDKTPFPLLYQLLSTPTPAPLHLSEADVKAEEGRLKAAMDKLQHTSGPILDLLPSLGADHILTTNYSYCLEKAFFPKADFSKAYARNRNRFRLHPEGKRETHYRLHTGYLAGTTGLWHIHGECSVSQGIVLVHDRYGRLLQRIESICSKQNYKERANNGDKWRFTSWPELFLYGDVYILGFGMYESEFDLWWLLRRKQRERYGDGQVYFYEHPKDAGDGTRHLLLKACGVTICDVGCEKSAEYEEFYRLAMEDIREKMGRRRVR